MIEISRNQANALVAGNCPVPAYLIINGIQQEYRVTQVETGRSDFSLYGETPEMKFMAELEKVPMSESVVPVQKFGEWVTTSIPQPKKEKPELKYTELWMADTSKDIMGVISGYLTHGRYYEVLSTYSSTFGGLVFKVTNDAGYIAPYRSCWFKPVRLYDEDESELICRDIKFVEGDYIDLRKHTPEQIRHIAKFFQFYNLEDLLHTLENNPFIYWDSDSEFVGTDDINESCWIQDEYTYDDIFYSEE